MFTLVTVVTSYCFIAVENSFYCYAIDVNNEVVFMRQWLAWYKYYICRRRDFMSTMECLLITAYDALICLLFSNHRKWKLNVHIDTNICVSIIVLSTIKTARKFLNLTFLFLLNLYEDIKLTKCHQ